MISRRSAFLLVALAQAAIGAAAVFARLALVTGGALGVSCARLSIAALVMLAVAAARGALRPIDRRAEWRLMVAGLLLAVHFATWISSLRFASVAISTLLVCTGPVWTEAYAILRRRRVDAFAALSIAGALVGVAIVVGVPDRANTPLGIGLALAGAIAFAAYLIVVRAVDRRYDTVAITARTYGYAAIVLALAALASGPAGALPSDARGWGGVLAMALLSQLFGHTALNAGARVLSATFVLTLTLFEPVIAALLAAWLFGERVGPSSAIGAVVIIAAIGVALRGERINEGSPVIPAG